ncbi:hypothetical protein ETB97_008932 [Aspergillus alliaceus]|uniref:Cytochrome P450 n=1 Tax=Petromyces alliaceus TaxID=209559 RepID=A0A8H6AB78_PETAA|nr:hypothetical protein ETB97_008932 [Aspergillus burnettii]
MSLAVLLNTLLKSAVLLFWGYFLANEYVRWKRRIPGLKGPRGLPVIGNLLHVTKTFSAEQYRRWSLRYGPVYQVQLGNTPIVVVNSTESAKTLFLNQGGALISRPLFYVLHKVVSKYVASIGTSPWDESCRLRRKVAAGALNRPKVQSYEPFILRETRDFIEELTRESRNGRTEVGFKSTVHRLALNLVLRLNYGTRVANTKDLKEDALYSEIIEVEDEISRFRSPSKNLTNYIPLLRVLEPLVWKKSAAHSADIGRRRIAYNNILFGQLLKAIDENTDVPCIQGNVLRDTEAAGLSSNEQLSISLSMIAGADSTQPTIAWAILFLGHRQDIQQRAFAEIQTPLGSAYQPTATLEVEYIHALVKEFMRFYTVLPLAMPRETTAPVQVNGQVIPAGTMVFLNAWACNRDPLTFEDPWTFKPERWLDDTEKLTHQFAFGYGSRMCPASHLASRLVYSVLFHLIASFEIQPAEGEGDEIFDPIQGLKDPTSLAAIPKGSRARFVPRADNAPTDLT